MNIKLSSIAVGRRLRAASEAAVDAMCSSLREEGQLTPIIVREVGKAYELVDGNVRLQAAKKLGWGTVRVDVRSLTVDQATVLWAETAFQGGSLTTLERIRALAACKDVYDRLNPTARAGGDRVSAKAPSLVDGFVRRTAAAMQVSTRKLYAEIHIAKRLVPEVDRALRGSKFVNNLSVLRALSTVAPSHQYAAAVNRVRVGTAATKRRRGPGIEELCAKLRSSILSGAVTPAQASVVAKELLASVGMLLELGKGDKSAVKT